VVSQNWAGWLLKEARDKLGTLSGDWQVLGVRWGRRAHISGCASATCTLQTARATGDLISLV
jgi:hypothetical protein